MTKQDSKKVKVGDRLWHNILNKYVIVVEKDGDDYESFTYHDENDKNKGDSEVWKYVDFCKEFIWDDHKVFNFMRWYTKFINEPFNYLLSKKEIMEIFKKINQDDLFKINNISKEKRFIEIFHNYKILIQRDFINNNLVAGIVFQKNNDMYLIEYEKNTRYCYVSYDIWKIFEIEYNMDYKNIQLFLKEMISKYFDIKNTIIPNLEDMNCCI